MQIEQLLAVMSPDIYEKFKQAIETGKWLDGKALSEEQRETVLQAVLVYQAKVEQSDEHMTVGKNGQIVQKSRQQLQQELKQDDAKKSGEKTTEQDSSDSLNSSHLNIARFKQDDF